MRQQQADAAAAIIAANAAAAATAEAAEIAAAIAKSIKPPKGPRPPASLYFHNSRYNANGLIKVLKEICDIKLALEQCWY